MLNLDLMVLRDPARFQQLCFQLARYEFPGCVNLSASWDGGRDVVVFGSRDSGDIVFQCKFTRNLSAAKTKIAQSLDALSRNDRPIASWILCLPVEPSGPFMNWLETQLERHGLSGHVWARSELLRRLERHPDVLETFFYPILRELASHFRSEHLELVRLALDRKCAWKQPDPRVLSFSRRGNARSPDLVLDVIVRNRGGVATLLTGIGADVLDRRTKMHGLPGEGLLFPQITYAISIRGGRAGSYFAECEPPLRVSANDVERFKIRITETGYAWNGALRLSLHSSAHETLVVPVLRVFT